MADEKKPDDDDEDEEECDCRACMEAFEDDDYEEYSDDQKNAVLDLIFHAEQAVAFMQAEANRQNLFFPGYEANELSKAIEVAESVFHIASEEKRCV